MRLFLNKDGLKSITKIVLVSNLNKGCYKVKIKDLNQYIWKKNINARKKSKGKKYYN
jgi:hypothetical protein